MTQAKPKGRPVAADATPKALKAAQKILLSEGFARLSVERVASLTGLGKPTLYRRWSNAAEMAMAALLAIAPNIAAPKGTSLEAALSAQFTSLIAAFNSARGRQIVVVLAAADPKAPATAAFLQRLFADPRAATKAAFEAALSAGEIAPPPDLEALLDMLYAPILSRILLGHAPLDAELAKALVKTALMACPSEGAPERTPERTPERVPVRPKPKPAKPVDLIDLIEEPRQGSLF